MSHPLRVIELFAGVGGFHLGLANNSNHKQQNNNYKIVWANQWEPPGSVTKQFAYRCYESHFKNETLLDEYSNEDITKVLDAVEVGTYQLPKCNLLVGGFPCQDYSVARPLSQAHGIEGKKGILWWQIYRMLNLMGKEKPEYLFLENVDRMLKSPAKQRGRDFAIILCCLARLGYSVEWRAVNAADYGFPQKRRRVYLFAKLDSRKWDLENRVLEMGILAKALPVKKDRLSFATFEIPDDPYVISKTFGTGAKTSPFMDSGAMQNFKVTTSKSEPLYSGPHHTLGEILLPETEVPENYFVDENSTEKWKYHKGGKREERTNKNTGFRYYYTEGSMAYPDNLDGPSRTILTGEGGSAPSRSKHIVKTKSGKLRRLLPEELEALNGFPAGWTDTGMTDVQRAFCMGNALIVGIVKRIGIEIAQDARISLD